MLRLLIVFMVICQSVLAQNISVDERRQKILQIIDQELAEVNRLAKQQQYRSPDTILRMAELNLEKARHWREMENEQYLSLPPEERRKVSKASYFKRSARYFDQANKSASSVAKRFPKYKGLGDVYYILGFNHKELGNIKTAKRYMELAVNKATPRTKISYKAKLALADFRYNDRRYSEAIPLYEASINKIDERWYTKDAFNLAWCYYRTKQYDKAIRLMQDVHRKSSDKKYIDMRDVVERDIGIFYVDAGRTQDAVKFYEGLGLQYSEQFVKIANNIVTQGRYTQAEKLLEQAAKTEKHRDRRIEVLIAKLNLYDKFNKISQHLNVSKELVSLHKQQPLNNDQLRSLVFHIDKKAAELQKATASKTYRNVPKTRRLKSNQSITYFGLSAEVSPDKKAEKTFFQGETAYAARSYSKALAYYVSSFDLAKAQNDNKIISQSIEGMLSSLGQRGLSKKTANKYFVPVYTRYLSVDSKSNRAKTIFVKLFNAQFESKDISSAEKTVADFAIAFPEDYKTQEAMLAKVMEHYRQRKDYNAVRAYVTKINDGQFKVSKKYANALRSLMTKIQIEGVQQSLEKGEKGVALKGYHQIYESSESTANAKVNAAYNLAALYYELGDVNQSYNWGTRALQDMSVADVNKFSDSYLSMAAGLFLRQHFAQSADMSHRILVKLCKRNSSNKVVSYKNAVFISLANGDLDKALEIRNLGKKCLIPDATIAEVTLELLKDLAAARRWETYESLLADLETNSRNWPNIIKPYEELRLEYVRLGDTARASQVENKEWKFFKQARSQKLEVPVEALDLIAEKMLTGVISKKERLDQIALSFPEENFNNAVKLKLQILDQLTSEVNGIQKLGSGKGIVEAYRHVITAYEDFGNSLRAFKPEGKSPEYVASFQKAMSDVYNPILANARKLRSEIKKLIHDNKILSDSNFYVLLPESDVEKRFLSNKETVLMDRRGVR